MQILLNKSLKLSSSNIDRKKNVLFFEKENSCYVWTPEAPQAGERTLIRAAQTTPKSLSRATQKSGRKTS